MSALELIENTMERGTYIARLLLAMARFWSSFIPPRDMLTGTPFAIIVLYWFMFPDIIFACCIIACAWFWRLRDCCCDKMSGMSWNERVSAHLSLSQVL